jgi:Spy/CpxP family protein refolding chaperone
MMLGVLDLTDEQKGVIAKLVEDSRVKLHADIEAVLTPEQVEKLQQLQDDGATHGFAVLDLTEEQQTAIAEIRENARAEAQAAETPEARQEIMQAAHEEVLSVLTDEQIEKLEQLSPGAPRGRGGHGKGHMGIGPRGPYAGPDGPLAALDLTEEQEAAIADIRENARSEAQAAETPEARQEIMQAAHEEVLSVLTDEQIEKLEQSYPRTPWGRGGSGRGRW